MGVSEYTLRLITGPTVEPVSLEEAKAHCVVEHDEDDLIISSLITAARRHVEARINQVIVRQKWRLSLPCFYDETYLYRLPPQSIDAVQYIDTDGVTQTASSSLYELDRPAATLRLAYDQTWPNTRYQSNAVWVDFWCGFFDPTASPLTILADIPEDLRIAILLMVENMYSHRGQKSEIELYRNDTFDLLIQPYWMPQ